MQLAESVILRGDTATFSSSVSINITTTSGKCYCGSAASDISTAYRYGLRFGSVSNDAFTALCGLKSQPFRLLLFQPSFDSPKQIIDRPRGEPFADNAVEHGTQCS